MELFIMLFEYTVYILSLYFFYYLFRNNNFSYTRYVFVIFQLIAVLIIIKSLSNNGFNYIDLFLDISAYEVIICRLYFGVYKIDLKYSKILNTVNNLQINYIILSNLDNWEMNTINDLSKTLENIDSYFKIKKKYKTLGRIYLNETQDYYIINVLIKGKENEPFPVAFGSIEVLTEYLEHANEYIFSHKI